MNRNLESVDGAKGTETWKQSMEQRELKHGNSRWSKGN